MAVLATLAVLAIVVFVIPTDGSWQGPLVLIMLTAIVSSTLYEFHERKRRKRD